MRDNTLSLQIGHSGDQRGPDATPRGSAFNGIATMDTDDGIFVDGEMGYHFVDVG